MPQGTEGGEHPLPHSDPGKIPSSPQIWQLFYLCVSQTHQPGTK